MVFQDYALYPHMSVRQNMGFGLKMRGTAREKIAEVVERTAEILQIKDYLERRPKELSGGQRQRVAIGRAIAREPRLFLFDEPLSNLDAKLRVEMRTQIKRLHMAFKATSIYVTHDQTEAMTLADRIVVLRDRAASSRSAPPEELYSSPANLFVAGFIGSPTMNFLNAQDRRQRQRPRRRARRRPAPADPARRRRPLPRPTAGREVVFGIRPEHLTNVWEEGSTAARVPIEVNVELAEPLGADTLVFTRLGESEVVCRMTTAERISRRRYA